MGYFFNIWVLTLSAAGSFLLWNQYLNDWAMDYSLIIIFLIYLLAVVPTVMWSEHIKSKYQIPNESKTIIFNGKKFKKKTFDPIKEIPSKGILLGLIIAIAAFGSFTIIVIIRGIFGF
jgi:hypothetical protein